jgi:hypothetical protein
MKKRFIGVFDPKKITPEQIYEQVKRKINPPKPLKKSPRQTISRPLP